MNNTLVPTDFGKEKGITIDQNADWELLVDTLRGACDQINNLGRQAAVDRLMEWETEPGYHYALAQILLRYDCVSAEARFIAALRLKNGIDKYWRNNAPNGMSPEEKEMLRKSFMMLFNEPENPIAIQIAVFISKAARFDFPQEWPNLINELVSVMGQSEQRIIQHRALLTLTHVIKVLASKRLAGDRRIFQNVASELFPLMFDAHCLNADSVFMTDISDMCMTSTTLEIALLTTRILRKLVIHGFLRPSDNALIANFIDDCFKRATTLLSLVSSSSGCQVSRFAIDLVQKWLVQLLKVPLQMLEHHPYAFVPFIQTSLHFATQFLFTSTTAATMKTTTAAAVALSVPSSTPCASFERLIIQCLTMIKNVVSCAEYKPSNASIRIVSNGADEGKGEQGAHQVSNFFADTNRVTQLLRELITRYLPLTQDEIDTWTQDAEGFAASDEGGDLWRYQVRACAQATLKMLHLRFHHLLTPLVLEMMMQCDDAAVTAVAAAPAAAIENNSYLTRHKDAVYLVAGLFAANLLDRIDPDVWLKRICNELNRSRMLPEIDRRILRRRLAWLVSETRDLFSSDENRTLYELLMPMLSADEDIVVRLTAAQSLRQLFDHYDFTVESLTPYLSNIFQLLFQLLVDAQECDTKMNVLHVMAALVQRMGGEMPKDHVQMLIESLPALWHTSVDHSMLRCAIVSMLCDLVTVGILATTTADNSVSFACDVVNYCTDLKQHETLYLMEDGLRLWLAVAETARNLPSSWLQLFALRMPSLLSDAGTEHLALTLRILDCYMAGLAPAQLVCSGNVLGPLSDLIIGCNSNGITLVTASLLLSLIVHFDAALQAAPAAILACFQKFSEMEEKPKAMTGCLDVLAQVAICSRSVFLSMVGSTDTLILLLNKWLQHMDRIAHPVSRKRSAMALCAMLNTIAPLRAATAVSLIDRLLECLHDIVRIEADGQRHDELVLGKDSFESDDDDSDDNDEEQQQQQQHGETAVEYMMAPQPLSEHCKRLRKIRRTDPVHTIPLDQFLQNEINKLKTHPDLKNTIISVEQKAQLRDFIDIDDL